MDSSHSNQSLLADQGQESQSEQGSPESWPTIWQCIQLFFRFFLPDDELVSNLYNKHRMYSLEGHQVETAQQKAGNVNQAGLRCVHQRGYVISKFSIVLAFIASVAVLTFSHAHLDDTFVAPWRDLLFENALLAVSICGFLISYLLRSLCTMCWNGWRVQLPKLRSCNLEKPSWLDWLHSFCTLFELCFLKLAIDICSMHDVQNIGKGQSAAIAMRYLNGTRMFVLWFQTLFLLRPGHARCVLILAFVIGIALDFIPQSSVETTISYSLGNVATDVFEFFLTVPPIWLLIHYSNQFHACNMREIATGSDTVAASPNAGQEPRASTSASGIFEADQHASSARALDGGHSSMASTPTHEERVHRHQRQHCPLTPETTVCPSDYIEPSAASRSRKSSSYWSSLPSFNNVLSRTSSNDMQHSFKSTQQLCGELQQRCIELESQLNERKMLERDLLSRWYHAFACSQTWHSACTDSETGGASKTVIMEEGTQQPLKVDKTSITDHPQPLKLDKTSITDHPQNYHMALSGQPSSALEGSSMLSKSSKASKSSKSSDEPLEGSYACMCKVPVLEHYLCATHMRWRLSQFAGNNGWGDTLLRVFENLMQLGDSAAALILVSDKRHFKYAIENELLTLEPVDDGYRTKQFEGINVQDEAFARLLREFATHRRGDRDPDGHPTDGALVVTKSGIVVAAAVKVCCKERSDRSMNNVGTRHGTAVDGIATLNKSREYPYSNEEQHRSSRAASHCDAAFVLSESNVITVFLGDDRIAFRCRKMDPRETTDCHKCRGESSFISPAICQ